MIGQRLPLSALNQYVCKPLKGSSLCMLETCLQNSSILKPLIFAFCFAKPQGQLEVKNYSLLNHFRGMHITPQMVIPSRSPGIWQRFSYPLWISLFFLIKILVCLLFCINGITVSTVNNCSWIFFNKFLDERAFLIARALSQVN